MLGYDENDVGQAPDWRTLVHSDDMSRVQAAIRDHVAGKTPIFESLHRMRHATGEWRWVISRAKARVDDKGRLLRLVGVELDITERKLYEEALFREKESAQITLQSIGDGVITTDAKGVIDYVNPVAESLTGWRLEDAQGRAIEEIFRAFHEETCEPLENPLAVAIRRTRSIKSVRPMLLIRRDGNEIYVESTASPIRDGSGAVSGGVLVFHDVSEARELNRRLSLPREPRRAHRPREPPRIREPHGAGAEERQGARDLVCAVLPRSRPVQDRQRHLRPQRRRCAARPGRRAAQVQGPLARHAGAPGRRRIRHIARELHAGRGHAHGGDRCARRCATSSSPGRSARFRLGASIGVVPISADNADVASVLSRRRQRLPGGQGGRPQPRAQLRRERHRPDAPAPRNAVGRAHQQRARGGPLRAVPPDHPAAAGAGDRRALRAAAAHAR